MSFERVNSGNARNPKPTMTVNQSGQLYYNVPATSQYFDGVDRVAYYVDEETGRIGVDRGETGPDSYSLSEKNGGRYTAGRQVLARLGIDHDAVTGVFAAELEYDPDEGLLIADLSGLQAEVTPDAE